MNIAFRVDGSRQIGTGHIMRCLSLAHYLMENGSHCSFITRPAEGDLIEKISSLGINILELPEATATEIEPDEMRPYANWLGTSQHQDALDTIELLNGDTPDWIVIDHYAIDQDWARLLRPHCRHIMVLDDMNTTTHDCDVLLNQNLNSTADDYQSYVPEQCVVLTGPQFALLRPEFTEAADAATHHQHLTTKTEVLVSMGGVDATNTARDVLKAIANRDHHNDVKIHLVVGPSAPWKENLENLSKEMPYEIELHINPPSMAALMARADIAIIAAGSTSWECCAMAMPMIALPLVDNQMHVAEHLEQHGAALVVYPDQLERKLAQSVDLLINTPELRSELSRKASSLSDGKGGAKVSHILQQISGIHHAN
ncbi:MAG: UDP-2,4-diacetamido-2,4,6-trideoxy-beta-L-altropyranose hydrolase [Alphaproteobacteria bacterium]|nr:UDP-2,4-diacetamido-2,4,6-trideoxy-beta-L-altropyranose hydrolase [Alphaproteobacteria bacterium]